MKKVYKSPMIAFGLLETSLMWGLESSGSMGEAPERQAPKLPLNKLYI